MDSINKEKEFVLAPVITFNDNKELIVIHNYINMNGKMVLNKTEASLLYIELHKFIFK